MSDRTLPRLAALAVAAALAGCAVGPEVRAPEMPAVERFTHAEAAGDAGLAAREAAFWAGLGDPLLASLVTQALEANHDLRIALARYDQANALLREARFDQWPTLTAGGSASHVRYSADQQPGLTRDQRELESFEAGIDLGWELDLFGRVRRSVQANRAEVLASAADADALRIALVAELASAYFDLRGLQARLQVARDNAENQRNTLELVRFRVEEGRGTDFDSARAAAQLEATLSTIPALEAAVAVSRHRIAVLAGLPPQQAPAALDAPGPLPEVAQTIDPGTPGALLRRRPDIAAAEARVAAATARIGVATADLFPRFTLSGLLGTQAADVDDLFSSSSETRLVALGVDWSFLDVGRVRSRIAAADAREAEALARYEQTVLLALEETENALVRYARAQAEARHLAAAAQASADASELARLRFDGGAVGLLDVLDAERTQLAAEDAYAQARSRTAVALVSLYGALAGGWEREERLADASR